MAVVKLEINTVAFYKMMLKILDVVEEYADSILEWKGELGFLAEIADTPVTKQAIKPIRKEIKALLAKARQDAILYKKPKPRKMKGRNK